MRGKGVTYGRSLQVLSIVQRSLVLRSPMEVNGILFKYSRW